MINQISAEIIADSLNENGQRCTTFVLNIPRIVLAEFNTHRVISRNSASSRAIPFSKMVKRVEETPFVPIRFQKDHSGMQGNEYFEGPELQDAQESWLEASRQATIAATKMSEQGVTKQLCNRVLEPFLMHTIIATSTEWENFFALRAHPAAEIHIADCAEKMLLAYNESTPKQLKNGDWHIPFGEKLDFKKLLKLCETDDPEVIHSNAVKIATARCARVSYLNYEGKDDYEADLKLYDRLSTMGHWSPFEHCAQAVDGVQSGNFFGFKQLRKTFEGENKSDSRVKQK